MSAETPTIQIFPVETPVAGTPLEGFDYTKKCVEIAGKPKTEDIQFTVGGLTFLLEEEEILELTRAESAASQTLRATVKPIADELQCNIVVFVGHTHECFNYISTTGLTIPNTLPTIVLVVACFSMQKIQEYNLKQEMIDRNIYFFGFNNFMHVLKGEILACKENHKAIPYLNCRFDEVKNNIQKITANASEYTKPYEAKLDLLKCCAGRYEHFKQLFYDYLVGRECVRFTTEKLLPKLRRIRNPDGSLHRDTFASKTDLDNYIFYIEDGEPCTAASCSEGKTKYSTYKPNIAKFDDRIRFGNEATKKLVDIINDTSKYTPEEFLKKDKELVDILKAMPKPQALKSLQYSLVYRSNSINFMVPLFFFLFAENYKLSWQEVLKNHSVPLDIVLNANNYTLSTFILEHMNRKYVNPILTEPEAYRLLKAIGEKNRNALKTNYHINRLLFQNKKCYLSIIELLFRDFTEEITPLPAIIIRWLDEHVKEGKWTLEQAAKVLEIIVSFKKLNIKIPGALQGLSIINYYEGVISDGLSSSYNTHLTFLSILYVYIHEDEIHPIDSLNNKVTYWIPSSQSAKTYLKAKYNRILKAYQTTKDFFDKGGVEIQSYRKTPEQMKKLLDYDLAPMEARMQAIEEVKSFFSKVQPNIQKRKNLDTATKTAAIQELVAFYRGVNSERNEGENALRRLREMHSLYSEFLRNHPRENKTVPTVNAFNPQVKADDLWLYEIITVYIATLKTAKRATLKTTKRATTTLRKPIAVVNTTILQQELNNIKTRLNGHNSGATRLHHMTVKSLRKKKNVVEQKLRNLAPATPANAVGPVNATNAANNATNNATNAANNAANNHLGGRRTRKVRR